MKISAILALAALLLGGITLAVVAPEPAPMPAHRLPTEVAEHLHTPTDRVEVITIPEVLIVGERIKPARVEAKEKTWACTGGWKDLQQGAGQYRSCGWQ